MIRSRKQLGVTKMQTYNCIIYCKRCKSQNSVCNYTSKQITYMLNTRGGSFRSRIVFLNVSISCSKIFWSNKNEHFKKFHSYKLMSKKFRSYSGQASSAVSLSDFASINHFNSQAGLLDIVILT